MATSEARAERAVTPVGGSRSLVQVKPKRRNPGNAGVEFSMEFGTDNLNLFQNPLFFKYTQQESSLQPSVP